MKFLASYILLAIFSLVFGNNLTSVSASKNSEKESEVAAPNEDHNFSAAHFLDLINPSGGRISLVGIDPRQPLTKAEATFLETNVREILNDFYEQMGIDLFAKSVSISKDLVEDIDVDNVTNGSLRGASRKLPWSDKEMCDYQWGPKKGQKIPGCKFDIDFYMDHYCHQCRKDDDGYWAHDGGQFTPSQSPTWNRKYFNLFDDDWKPDHPTPTPTWNDKYSKLLDDDCLPEFPTQSPTWNEKYRKFLYDDDYKYANSSQNPTFAPSSTPSTVPTTGPSSPPTLAPTKKQEEENGVGEERGPSQPLIYVLPPPSPSPVSSRRRSPRPKNPNLEILKKLQQSPFLRFRNIRKIRFGGPD